MPAARNQTLGALLWLAIERNGLPLKRFGSSTGLLPAASVRSPDASGGRLGHWQTWSEAERDGVPPPCPDPVVERPSPGRLPRQRILKAGSSPVW